MPFPFSFFKKKISSFIPITNGLLAWWKFAEGSGTTAIDSSGNGNTGTLINSPSYVSGVPSSPVSPYSLQFNGSSQYITTTNAANFNFSSGNFSLSCWFKTTTQAGVIFTTIIPPSYTGWELCISKGNSSDNPNQLCFYNGSNWTVLSGNISDGGWHNAIVTFNAGNMLCYIDGAKVSTNSVSKPTYAGTPLWIAHRNAGPAPLYFNGDLSDMRIYNRILSSTEVSEIYNLKG